MGFNRRKVESRRAAAAEEEAAAKRATNAQVLEDAERLIAAWNERQPSACRCCSRQRSAARSRRSIGSCGYAVRPVAPRRRSIYGPSIATLGPRSQASSPRSLADRAGRTRRSLNLSAFLTKASPMRCASSARVAFSGNNGRGRLRLAGSAPFLRSQALIALVLRG
jgi:hypothetical protein